MNSSHYLLPISSWSSLSGELLGNVATRWRWLHTHTNATLESAIIPKQALTEHIVASGLYSKVLGVLRSNDFPEEVLLQTRLLIAKTPLPQQLIHQLWQWLSHHDASFVSVAAAIQPNETPLLHPHVEGENNVVESLLQTWASCISTKKLMQLKKTLNPADLTVQWWLRCLPNTVQSSGWLWTTHPWKQSSDWLIAGSWGDHPAASSHLEFNDHTWQNMVEKQWPEMDEWWIDKRSREILFHHKGSAKLVQQPAADGWKEYKPTQLQQSRACLSVEHVNALVKTVWSAKQKTPHQLVVRWYATPQKIFIADWAFADHKTHHDSVKPKATKSTASSKKLLTGHVVQQGHVTGPIRVIERENGKKNTVKGSILVTPKLELADAPMLIGASAKGIITEHPITHPSLIAQIKRYGIPTLSGVKQLKKSLLQNHRNQHITIKATKTGKLGFVIM